MSRTLDRDTINPFAAPAADPSADTLPLSADAVSATVLNDPTWRSVTVASLTEAEEFLDHLEACGAADRELVVLRDDRFAVRWR